ncbi:MAG: thioesterase family protein [Planctomycetota bacterium]
MESSVFEFSLVVTDEDIDELRHVNNLTYLKWCLKAAVAHSASVGWPASRYHEQGFGFVVREHRIKYRDSAFDGDPLLIETWIESMKKASSLRKYRITNSDRSRVYVQAETNWAYVNLKTIELCAIPTEIKEAFRNS